ncbi:MAG TPA: PilZ domain-containing protein [Candidatus Acidoferrales bacterium]|nr:PilZ domain-containing protein [Candidatus Acidoferrales bacterium]
MQSQVNWEDLGIQANQDRRRESRLPLSVPIEVTGFGADARFFRELTTTIDISESGCSFSLQCPVPRGGIVAIKIMLKEYAKENFARPFLYQIARAIEETGRWVVGAAKLQPESIWLVAFPKPTDPNETARPPLGE